MLTALMLAALLNGPRAVAANEGTATADPAALLLAGRAESVAQLLARRAHAVLAEDKASFLATIDPAATGFRRTQAALFDNLADVPLAEWRYRLDADTVYPAAASVRSAYDAAVWFPRVRLVYALAGVDAVPAEQEQVLTFVQRGTGWFIAADDDLAAAGYPTWRGLWDFGPVVATRGRSSLLLAHPGSWDRTGSGSAGLRAELDAAATAVTSVWGTGWAGSVAAVLPASQQELTALVGADLGLDRIAALATSSSTEPVSGQRILLNPVALGGLSPAVRRVVTRHEVAHLATAAATAAGTPPWLVEGFADYVGYLASPIPIGSASVDLAAAVRRGDIPAGLPDAASFRGDSPRLSQAYQEAWLACLLLVERISPAGLVRLYRASSAAVPDQCAELVPTRPVGPACSGASGPVSGAARFEVTFRDVVGISYPQFVSQWQAFVVERLT